MELVVGALGVALLVVLVAFLVTQHNVTTRVLMQNHSSSIARMVETQTQAIEKLTDHLAQQAEEQRKSTERLAEMAKAASLSELQSVRELEATLPSRVAAMEAEAERQAKIDEWSRDVQDPERFVPHPALNV